MIDQVAEQGVRESLFVRPGRVAKDAVKGALVRFLNFAHGVLQGLPYVGRLRSNVTPMTAVGNLKAMVFGERGIFLVSPRFLESQRYLLIIDIRNTLEKE